MQMPTRLLYSISFFLIVLLVYLIDPITHGSTTKVVSEVTRTVYFDFEMSLHSYELAAVTHFTKIEAHAADGTSCVCESDVEIGSEFSGIWGEHNPHGYGIVSQIKKSEGSIAGPIPQVDRRVWARGTPYPFYDNPLEDSGE